MGVHVIRSPKSNQQFVIGKDMLSIVLSMLTSLAVAPGGQWARRAYYDDLACAGNDTISPYHVNNYY